MGKFMSQIGNLGPGAAISAGSDLIGTAMGMALAGWQDRRQLKQQQKLTEMQVNAQKGMIDYQNQATFDMWQKTGPQGQVNQLKEAGLNPALMYGMGGGTGGQSVSQSASVGAGQTSQQSMAMGLSNMAQTAAQVKLMDAQARNLDAETNKTKGVDTAVGWATVESLNQGVKTQKASEALMEVQNIYTGVMSHIATLTQNAVVEQAETARDRAKIELEIDKNRKRISTETMEAEIATVNANLAYLVALKHATDQNVAESKSRIELNEAQIKKLANDIYIAQEQLDINRGGLKETERDNLHYRQNANLTELEKLIGQGATDVIKGFLRVGSTTTTKGYSDKKGNYTETKTTSHR